MASYFTKEAWWWWNYIRELLGYRHDRGHITLGYGKHEVVVTTAFKPDRVYLSCCDEGCPVCWGNLTLAAAVKTCDGFILCADVQSASCTIRWIAES